MTPLALGWIVAFTDAATESEPASPLPLLVWLVVLGGLFYVLLIRPQRRRVKAMEQMRDNVQVGDEVRTIGGIKGVVRSIDGDELVLDVGGGTSLNFVSRAVAEIIRSDEE